MIFKLQYNIIFIDNILYKEAIIKMLDKKSFLLGFGAACLAVVLIFNIHLGYDILSGNMSPMQKIEVIRKLIDENYVEEVDQNDLQEYIYAGYVAGLGDVYSTYMTAEQFDLFKESLEGTYSGIGIRVSLSPDYHMKVGSVYTNSPAHRAGILVGDELLTVGDINIEDEDSYHRAISFIKKSKDNFKVKGKHSDGSEFETLITTESIDVPSVCSTTLNNDIGYIRITEFDGNTAEQFDNALKELKSVDKLIIDLRDNPGGFLTTVNKIADTILPEGNITYVEYKNGDKKYYKSDENCLHMDIAVLVNGNSASASEVLTGAIKDYGAGTIVGTTTFGKGVVQDSFRLRDGSCVKLTVAKYYTPKGVCIHGTGIKPDVLAFATESFALPYVNDKKAAVDLKNDTQLQKAIQVLE